MASRGLGGLRGGVGLGGGLLGLDVGLGGDHRGRGVHERLLLGRGRGGVGGDLLLGLGRGRGGGLRGRSGLGDGGGLGGLLAATRDEAHEDHERDELLEHGGQPQSCRMFCSRESLAESRFSFNFMLA